MVVAARARGGRDADRLGGHRRVVAGAARSRSPSVTTTSSPRSASTRTRPPDGDVGALREALAHPKAVAVGETGLDYFRDYAPRDAQLRVFDAQLALASELSKPVVIHTRAADEDTLAALKGFAGTVVLHCFSSLPLLEPALERGWYVSFAGNVVVQERARHPRRRRSPFPPIGCSRKPIRRTSTPVPRRGRPNEPANVVHVVAALARARNADAGGARRADRRQRRALLRPVSVRPRKRLGQHFLVDENILGVIERLAEPAADDVVLEIGPGLGILTRFLADRVALVHAVEIDRSLEPHLPASDNVRVHWGDALDLDLAALEPPPRKLVANLPYNVATPIVVESLDGLPSIERWCVMVQREVADRFFARPGTKAYGAVSVLVQLATERTGFHAVSREVFRPRPNVDSALVAFRRVELPADYARVKTLVEAAFAHRRKTLPNSLRSPGVATRAEAEEALRSARTRAGARAEALEPHEFVALARGSRLRRASANAKINLALLVGPKRADGYHEVATVLQRIDLADEVDARGRRRAERHRVSRRHARDARARAARPRPTAESRAGTCTSRSGSRSPPGSAAAAPTPRRRSPSRTRRSPATQLHDVAAQVGSDVPFFLTRRPAARDGNGHGPRAASSLPQDYWIVLVLPHDERKESTAAVYARFDGAAGFDERRAELLDASGAFAARPTSRAAAERPRVVAAGVDDSRELGAFRADVSGAGPAVYGLFVRERRRARRGAPLAAPRANLDRRHQRGTVERDVERHVSTTTARRPAAGFAGSGCSSPSGSPVSRRPRGAHARRLAVDDHRCSALIIDPALPLLGHRTSATRSARSPGSPLRRRRSRLSRSCSRTSSACSSLILAGDLRGRRAVPDLRRPPTRLSTPVPGA